MGLRQSRRYFWTMDQLETNIWVNLPIFSNVRARFRDSLENQDPVVSTMAFKKDLHWCESEICKSQNLISPRPNERVCVFCGYVNDLSTGNELGYRPDRSKFDQIYQDTFPPFMSFVQKRFCEEPYLAYLGLEVGIRTFQSGMRVRYSIVIHKKPFLETRKGFEYGALNSGLNNRFAIPTKTERALSNDILGGYKGIYLSKDPKPLRPVFDDKSPLLGLINED